MSFLKDGKEIEKEFSELFKDVVFSSKEEDINEHWDLKISFKYDIKSVKKINRDDSYPNENYHFVEIKNVNGKLGWLYSEADFFVFETFNYYIIVKKEKLQEFVKNNVKKTKVNSPDKALYCLYQRSNRKDIITMVNSLDLMYIADTTIKKKENKYFNIGESINPKIREQEKINKILCLKK
jgi:hypothetical protein